MPGWRSTSTGGRSSGSRRSACGDGRAVVRGGARGGGGPTPDGGGPVPAAAPGRRAGRAAHGGERGGEIDVPQTIATSLGAGGDVGRPAVGRAGAGVGHRL